MAVMSLTLTVISLDPGGPNRAAHSLAKWSNNVFGSFDVGFGPSYFESIIKEGVVVSSL